jgi:RNA polymerase sigma-70 factor (ECF subfamily)
MRQTTLKPREGRRVEVTEESSLPEADSLELEAAYAEFAEPLWRAVLGYSGGSRAIADDAVAESFAAATQSIGAIRNLRPWLYRVAFRAALRDMKQRQELRYGEQRDVAARGSEVLSVELVELLAGLPPKQRGALVLCDAFGFRSREAAEILGSTDVAVRVSLHSARRRMRSILEQEEADE